MAYSGFERYEIGEKSAQNTNIRVQQNMDRPKSTDSKFLAPAESGVHTRARINEAHGGGKHV
jgi:hypothetical protein